MSGGPGSRRRKGVSLGKQKGKEEERGELIPGMKRKGEKEG
jgi:hypothetical protein